MQEPVVKRKPYFAIGVGAAVFIVLAVALIVTYSIFDNSYKGNLEKLTGMVADAAGQFGKGDGSADATASDQYRFYLTMDAQITNLSGILEKLNGNYPLLFGKATEETAGITDLRAKMDELMPGLKTYKECIDENNSIAGELAAFLGSDKGGKPADYAALTARNDALATKAAGLSFFGGLEGSRAAMTDSVAKRATALKFLEEDAAVNERLSALLSDLETKPADLLGSMTALLAENDALKAKAAEVNVGAYVSEGVDIEGMLAARTEQLNTCVAYLTEMNVIAGKVATLNGKIDQGLDSGKFTARLAAWMACLKEYNTLDGEVKAANAKPEYAAVTSKRSLETLGLSSTGLSLPGWAAALNTVNTANSGSQAIEKEIDALLKNTKLAMVTRVTQLIAIKERNGQIIASAAVEAPESLAGGLANFIAGCQERTKFLEEYIQYSQDKALASGHLANQKIYQAKYTEYKEKAETYPEDSVDREFYLHLAKDQQTFANSEYNDYKTLNKTAETHRKAYEASRKKYQPLLDK